MSQILFSLAISSTLFTLSYCQLNSTSLNDKNFPATAQVVYSQGPGYSNNNYNGYNNNNNYGYTQQNQYANRQGCVNTGKFLLFNLTVEIN